ncbi:MAG: glycosyltransferase, partial [bacterium]
MTHPRVTIGLLTWNGSATLPACLASLLTQTFTDWEFVALDNGSRDESATMVGAWCAANLPPDRWRLVKAKSNTGYAAGMNAIAERSRGEFLLALNQDVALHPAYSTSLISLLDTHPKCAAVCGRVYRSAELAVDEAALAGVAQSAWGGGRTIDSTGHVLYRDRVVMNRRGGQVDDGRDKGEFREKVFGVPGSCPMYR